MFNPEITKILVEHYHARDHNNNYAKNNLGFGFLHYAFIRNLRPKKVLVVGSQRGYVPAICALACKDEGKGKVDFVDAGYDYRSEDKDEARNSWGGLGTWKDVEADYWDALGVSDFIDLHVTTVEKFENTIKGEYGYIYIDGNHSYSGVKRDYDSLWGHLENNGLMVFHDVRVDKETDWGKCGVKQFWGERLNFCKDINKITIFESAGLGILQK